MRDLTVTLLQADLAWHDPAANRARLGALIAGLQAPADLLVLPEMFTTGFTMDDRAPAVGPGDATLEWLAAQAAASGAVVAGSVRWAGVDGFRNRLLWMRPDGSWAHYDKRHLFRMADEQQHYLNGTRRVVLELHGWRVCPLICYDLRFPVWSRNRGDFDLLLYVANWPAARRAHWQALLRARAIENQVPVVAVNRVGGDGNGIDYAGDSVVLDAHGEALVEAGAAAGAFAATLGRAALEEYRRRFPVALDGDRFDLASD
ncbi:MAG TPA: amidohydrolase [Gammaproteobacteria bacterium]